MDENRLIQLMGELDDDLFAQALEPLMEDIDIDMDSVSQKAHWKLRKEQRTMKKTRKKAAVGIVAACLVAVFGVATAYASEISDFFKALLSKSVVEGMVVEGGSYYLESPVDLDGYLLTKVNFTEEYLDVFLEISSEDFEGLSVEIDGERHVSSGATISPYDPDVIVYFGSGLTPTSEITLILNGKSYPVTLTAGEPATSGDVTETTTGDIPWISMGHEKTPDGVQVFVTLDDPDVELFSIFLPDRDFATVSLTSEVYGTQIRTDPGEFLPLIGRDQDGNVYEYRRSNEEGLLAQTLLVSDAPADKAITLEIPGIIVSATKSLSLEVPLPENGKKTEYPQTIDLGLQRIDLEAIERTSETTARLTFTLDTGEQEQVRILYALILSQEATGVELMWKDGVCTMDVTFPGEAESLNLSFDDPNFIIDGNWTLDIE